MINTKFFSREGGGGRIQGCATVLVSGQYIDYGILYRTASSSVSSNQGLAIRERSLKIVEKQ